MSSRGEFINVNIDSLEEIVEPPGFAISATVDGQKRKFTLTESASGSFLSEGQPEDPNVSRLGRTARACVLEEIESELLRPLARGITKKQLRIANQLAFLHQADRDAAERPVLVAEVLTLGEDAFRLKYRLAARR